MSLARPLPRPALALPDWRRPFRALGDAYGTARDRIAAARAAESSIRTLLDDLAPDWVEHLDDAYVVGANGREVWTRALVIRSWPATVKPGRWAELLFGLGGDLDITLAQHSHRVSLREAKRRLRTQRVVQQSVAQARAERGALEDFDELADLGSATRLAQQVTDKAESLFAVDVALLVRAPTREALDAATARVQERLEELDFACGGMKWQQAAGFRSVGTVYATPALNRAVTLDTTSLAFALPFLTTNIGTGSGPLWGVTLADKAPLHVDLWDEAAGWTAPHVVIVGPTGGGKTVTIGHLLAEHLAAAEPPDVVVLDSEKGDYRRLARELDGRIVRLGASADGQTGATLNAFDLPPAEVLSGTGEPHTQNPVREQTRLATGLIALMVAEPAADGTPGRLTKGERAVTEQAILAAYAAKGVDADAPATWDAPPAALPRLPDVLAALERLGAHGASPAAVSLAERVRPFCTGTLAGLFSAPTNVPLGAGFTSFDLAGMDGELRPLAVWLVGNHVWAQAHRDRRKRILVLEEVRSLLEHPESARLVARLYGLGRAYRISVWSATQLLSDYANTQEGERALQNADTVLLLRQAAGKGSQDARDRYGLSEQDRAYLEACGRGRGLVVTPKGQARIEILPPSLVLEWMGGPAVAALDPNPYVSVR